MQGNVLDFGKIQVNGMRYPEGSQSLGQTEWSLLGAAERGCRAGGDRVPAFRGERVLRRDGGDWSTAMRMHTETLLNHMLRNG